MLEEEPRTKSQKNQESRAKIKDAILADGRKMITTTSKVKHRYSEKYSITIRNSKDVNNS